LNGSNVVEGCLVQWWRDSERRDTRGRGVGLEIASGVNLARRWHVRSGKAIQSLFTFRFPHFESETFGLKLSILELHFALTERRTQVYPAAGFANTVQRNGGKVAVFNVEASSGDARADWVVLGKCEETLARVLLGAS